MPATPARRFLQVLAALIFVAETAHGVNVGGPIDTSTTWAAASSPYVVTSDVVIGPAATLTIEPGVVVKFNQFKSLTVNGTLLAEGTSALPITFTSNQATPTAGYWRSITFNTGAAPSASRLTYATVSFGGQAQTVGTRANVYVNGSSPEFDHVTLRNAAVSGMRVIGSGANPTIANSTLQSNGEAGLRVEAPAAATVASCDFVSNSGWAIEVWSNSDLYDLTGITASGNGGGSKNGIRQLGGTISGSEAWLPALFWYVENDVTVGTVADPSATLTIAPGVVAKFNQFKSLTVNGTLLAEGTPALPITFTSNQATPTAGYWRSITFSAGAAPSASRISHATVSYGGQNLTVGASANIYVNGSSPAFDQLTIRNAGVSGVRVIGSGANPTITNSTFQSNGGAGLRVEAPAAATVSNCDLVSNGGWAIEVWSNSDLYDLTGITASANGGGSKNGIRQLGGTISGSETWLPALFWYVESDVTVGEVADPSATLTIAPGVVAKFNQFKGLTVNGTLLADGTSALPITFTSNQATPTAGYWRSITFSAGAAPSASRISHAMVSYGGQNLTVGANANIYVEGSSPELRHLI